jgi:hypothetical protein
MNGVPKSTPILHCLHKAPAAAPQIVVIGERGMSIVKSGPGRQTLEATNYTKDWSNEPFRRFPVFTFPWAPRKKD